jgi:hypothetical protein
MTTGQLKAAGAVAVAWLFWWLYTHPARSQTTIDVNVLSPTFGEQLDDHGNVINP